jgi:GTP-binding protein EngB required for normal cell division
MKHFANNLQNDLDKILGVLDQQPLFSFTPAETHALKDKVERLSQKLASIDQSLLTIGILGGTGVGKSTLMNALANAAIASTSHRRPHTDQVLIYRHVEAGLPSALRSTGVPWQEITHHADSMQQILLCDLPDFDSLVHEHRAHVLDFLEHLDLLIWVTSPEKYGDGRFYELLRDVPKARQNFFFVLNKIDLLFDGDSLEVGYKQLERVNARFLEHIREQGIENPYSFSVSAQEAIDSGRLSPWNHFPVFKQEVFQQRNVKQIMAIKADNLDVEVQQVLSSFNKEVANLQVFERMLESSIDELKKGRGQWNQGGQGLIDLWIERHIGQHALVPDGDLTALKGPGHSIALLFHNWKKGPYGNTSPNPDISTFVPPEKITDSFKRRIEWIEDRLTRMSLGQNLPSPLQKRLIEAVDVNGAFNDLGERFSNVVALHVLKPALPSFRLFKALQSFTYLLLFLFLLLVIGGESAWQEVLTDPGGANIFRLFISGIETLFSAKGLAALLSYALLNLFFALRFYGRYKKLLRRRAQKIMASLKVGLREVWEERLDSIVDDLNRLRGEIRSQSLALSALRQEIEGR